jgi:hypothetical protein
VGAVAVAAAARGGKGSSTAFTETFALEECTWSATGANRFFNLTPGAQQTLAGEEDGTAIEVIITALDETEDVNGVTTRVIEEHESEDGAVVEISRNFFALCNETNSVFYFGEEVDDYEDGEIVGHQGAWRAGVDGARAGLFMPGLPLLGARYYQEIAEGVAMDRVEIVSLTESVTVPAGSYDGCLETFETTPLEPKVKETKRYCPGVGLVDDAGMTLVSVVIPD